MQTQQQLTERFQAELKNVESAHAMREPFLELFHPEVELSSVASHTNQAGPDGARTFWTRYLSAFESMQSEFTVVHTTENSSVLEWVTRGTLLSGRSIEYKGVSILVRGPEGSIREFRTYYDSAAFALPTEKTADRQDSATVAKFPVADSSPQQGMTH